MATDAPPRGGLQTLDRALAILALFDAATPEWSAAEVSRELNLTLPTASRFLRGMEERGLLMRAGDRRYRLGFSLIELGQRALQTLTLRDRLHPVLVELAHQSGATALLATLTERGEAARIVDRADAATLLQVALQIGHVWPLHAGAMGKSLLAHHPECDTFLSGRLEPIGPRTVTDPAALRRELEEIRRRGWAFSSQETEIGAWGIAAPVLGEDGYPLCSVGLVEPIRAHSPGEEHRLVERTLEGARRARERLLGTRVERLTAPSSSGSGR